MCLRQLCHLRTIILPAAFVGMPIVLFFLRNGGDKINRTFYV